MSKISFSFLEDCSRVTLCISVSSISIGYVRRNGSKLNPVSSRMISLRLLIISSNILLILGGKLLFNRLRISSPSRSTCLMDFSNSSSISSFREKTNFSISTSRLSIIFNSLIIGIMSPRTVSLFLIFWISWTLENKSLFWIKKLIIFSGTIS